MHKPSWWLLGVLLVAAGLRLMQLGSIPGSLYWDEVAMLVDAKAVAQTGHDMHGRPWFQVMYPSYGDYKLPVYIWLASLAVMIGGVNEAMLRLPSALAGIATVGVIAALAAEVQRAIRPAKSQLLWLPFWAALTVALSPWAIGFARTGFESQVAQMILAASVLMMVKARNQSWWWWLAPVVGALATYTYFSVRFVWPPVMMLVAWWLMVKPGAFWPSSWQVLVKKWLWPVAASLAIFGLCLIPMRLSPLYQASTNFRLGTTSVLNAHDYAVASNVLREQAGNHIWDRLIFHRQVLMAKEVLLNYSDHLSWQYLFVKGDRNLRHGTGWHGLFAPILLPFWLIGWGWWWKKQPTLALLWFGWWLVALLPASIPEDTPHSLRSLNSLVPLSLVIAGGLTAVVEFWSRWSKHLATAGAVMMVASTGMWWYHYQNFYPTDSFTAWQGNYREVAQAIFQLRQSQEQVGVIDFDYRFYLWLLAYGPYRADQYQTWPTQGFLFHDFDGIVTDWREPVSSPMVIAGLAAKVRDRLATESVTIVQQLELPGPTADSSYLVVRVVPQVSPESGW